MRHAFSGFHGYQQHHIKTYPLKSAPAFSGILPLCTVGKSPFHQSYSLLFCPLLLPPFLYSVTAFFHFPADMFRQIGMWIFGAALCTYRIMPSGTPVSSATVRTLHSKKWVAYPVTVISFSHNPSIWQCWIPVNVSNYVLKLWQAPLNLPHCD